MAASITPAKRQLDRNFTVSHGKRKWQKSSGAFSQNQMKFASGSIILRFLCPVSKSGSIIGKGGATITQIRQETGAKVKIEDTIPGCDERIVTIVGSDQEVVANSEDDEEIACEEENMEEKDDDATEPEKKDHEDEDSVAKSDTTSVKGTSSVQRALLLLFERLVQGDVGNEVGNGESINSSACVFRLLVLSSQIGCILGKGGSVIKQMAAESGAQIRIIPKDKFPSCASGAGELVQVSGGVDAVRRAVKSISQQLLENHRDNDSSANNIPEKLPHSKAEAYALVNHPQGASHIGPNDDADSQSADPHIASKFHESSFSDRMNTLPPDTLSFRLWCPAERVGVVIGKGGTIIKTMQQETHCEIRVLEGVPDSEDRIILVSGIARPEERISAVQDAVLRVQSRIGKAVPDSKEQNVIAKILVPSNQIGCLLGKGGSVIAEMRKSSTAHIRIMGKDQIPKFAAEDEVVQINGDFDSVQEALLQITTRLQQNFFRNAFPSMKYSSNPAMLDQGPPFPSFMGRRELSPPGVFSNFGPTFAKFNSVSGLAPYGSLRSHDDRQSFMHNIHRPGIPPFLSDRKPWGSRGFVEDGGPLGLPDFVGAPHRRIGGLGGGSQSAIITNTTVEVVVPHSLVPEIYGEDGECLRQIRQISDAKITITEAKPGAVETVIIISGTPEQTHAAQSLIQAFVMCGSESS